MMLQKIALSVGAAIAMAGASFAIASPASADETCWQSYCSVGYFSTYEECNVVKNDFAQRFVILVDCTSAAPQQWFFAYQKPLES